MAGPAARVAMRPVRRRRPPASGGSPASWPRSSPCRPPDGHCGRRRAPIRGRRPDRSGSARPCSRRRGGGRRPGPRPRRGDRDHLDDAAGTGRPADGRPARQDPPDGPPGHGPRARRAPLGLPVPSHELARLRRRAELLDERKAAAALSQRLDRSVALQGRDRSNRIRLSIVPFPDEPGGIPCAHAIRSLPHAPRPAWRRSSWPSSPRSSRPIRGPMSRSRRRAAPRRPRVTTSSSRTGPGRYFVARPLKEKYEGLVKRVGELKAEIDDARIDEPGARREIERLQAEIDEAIRAIDKAKVYVPGATIRNRAAVQAIPLGPGDLLLVEAEDVEIRGGDGPEVKCVLKKTVLGELGQESGLAPDFDGIELVVRKSSGKEMFGFYKAAAERPALRHEYERFAFKPFLDREFTVVSIKGLTYQEGNRQIRLEATNEEGAGQFGSDWRTAREAAADRPEVRGSRRAGGPGRVPRPFAQESTDDPGRGQPRLSGALRGHGARRAAARRGHPAPPHRGGERRCLDPRHGLCRGHDHVPPPGWRHHAAGRGPGVVLQGHPRRPAGPVLPGRPGPGGIGGRVDVENAFGKTVWRSERPVAATDHRIVSQSGPIEVRFASSAPGELPLSLFTECGAIRLPRGNSRPGVADVPRQPGRRDQPLVARLPHRRRDGIATRRILGFPVRAHPRRRAGARAARRASTSSAGPGRSLTSRPPRRPVDRSRSPIGERSAPAGPAGASPPTRRPGRRAGPGG